MTNFDRQSQSQDRTQSAQQGAKQQKAQQQRIPPKGPPSEKPKSKIPPVAIALGGGVVAAAIIVGVLLGGSNEAIGTKDRPALTTVKSTEVDQAAGTLAPEQKAKIVEDAKACRAPLATVTFTKVDGGGTVRIRAGGYLSPPFVVGDTPVSVAIPFPAPYETGKGEISIEGAAKGVFLQLSPGLNVDNTAGALKIPVWWKTDKPCGS